MDSNAWTKLFESLPAGLMIGLWLFGLILIILWILLPFAVFGIHKRIVNLSKNVLPEMEDANDHIMKVVEEITTLTAEVRKANQFLAIKALMVDVISKVNGKLFYPIAEDHGDGV